MNPRPTALELLTAAREHLAQKVLPNITDPQLKFQTLVAAHVLGVVERELAAGPAKIRRQMLGAYAALLGGRPSDKSEDALDAALAASQKALCDAIRAGRFDDDAHARPLLDTLNAMVEGSLQLWNPAFLARVKRAG